MDTTSNISRRTVVRLVGAVDHPDFRGSVSLLRTRARRDNDSSGSPEVVVVFQARPGQISHHEIELLQRRWPLAGIVAVVGSWCEGELRTGRPWPGVKRVYWYEFPVWWQQQLKLRHAGSCPEWARPSLDPYRSPPIRNPQGVYALRQEIHTRQHGLILLSTANRDAAGALADVLHQAGYAAVWNPPGQPMTIVRGAVAGIWEGGQLDEREERGLAAFCRLLARDAAPVAALLDFPRVDRGEVAKQLGVAAVLGKPWINADLIATIDDIASRNANVPATSGRAA